MSRKPNRGEHEAAGIAASDAVSHEPVPSVDDNALMPVQANAAVLEPARDVYDEARYRAVFRDAPYYSSGRDWTDYAPAYRYGHQSRDNHQDCRFSEVEQSLAEGWEGLRAQSRLVWAEARGAVLDAWQQASEERSVQGLGEGTGTKHEGGH